MQKEMLKAMDPRIVVVRVLILITSAPDISGQNFTLSTLSGTMPAAVACSLLIDLRRVIAIEAWRSSAPRSFVRVDVLKQLQTVGQKVLAS
jgi:hypothetical protein